MGVKLTYLNYEIIETHSNVISSQFYTTRFFRQFVALKKISQTVYIFMHPGGQRDTHPWLLAVGRWHRDQHRSMIFGLGTQEHSRQTLGLFSSLFKPICIYINVTILGQFLAYLKNYVCVFFLQLQGSPDILPTILGNFPAYTTAGVPDVLQAILEQYTACLRNQTKVNCDKLKMS